MPFVPALALPLLLLAAAPSAHPSDSPVLVELFTSEGCSSCPAADALLLRLAHDQPVAGVRVIALGEHVDYWNDLGWRDRFSDAIFSRRQAEHARRLGGSLYTPQVVVDGEQVAPGSSARAVRAALTRAAARPKGELRLAAAGAPDAVGIRASWPEDLPADVFLAVTVPSAESVVTRGENAGKRLTHAAVALALARVGTGRGSFETEVPIPRQAPPGATLVAFVEEQGSGRIVAVAEAPLPAPGGSGG